MKTLKKIYTFIFILMLIILLKNRPVYAAASTTLSSSSTSVTVGDNVTITVKVNSTEAWDLKLSTSGGTLGGTTVDADSAGEEVTKNVMSATFSASSAGTYTIKLSGYITGSDLNKLTVDKSITITVKEATTTTNTNTTTTTTTTTTKSSDATLKSITVGSTKYTSGLTSISQTVDYSMTSIKISAVQNNSSASISGTGTKSLSVGTNSFTIKVTAEDGTTKSYSVKVIRLADDTVTPNVIEDDGEEEESTPLTLTSLIIKDVDLSPEFSSDVYSYVANVTNMTELEIDASASNPEAVINIEGATELQEGDNIIKITVTLGDESVEYIIDVYNTVQEEVVGAIDDGGSDDDSSTTVGFWESVKTIITENFNEILLITLICLLAIVAIWFAILSYKYSRKLNAIIGAETVEENVENEEILLEDQEVKKENSKIGRHF